MWKPTYVPYWHSFAVRIPKRTRPVTVLLSPHPTPCEAKVDGRATCKGMWRDEMGRTPRVVYSESWIARETTSMSTPASIIGSPVSPYVRKVLAVCELKGVAYRLDPIVPFYGDDRFSQLNPLRRIPILIDDKVSIS